MFQNRAEGLALALPAALFAALVFLVPVVLLLSEGFRNADQWTLSAYVDFFSQPLNRTVFLRTLKLSALVTLVAAVIGYAAAYAIVSLPPGAKGRMVGLVVLPLMISPVARTYAWIVILGRTGIINQALQAIGLTVFCSSSCR
jgi:putative spermidine/putrescine transport system permease protein